MKTIADIDRNFQAPEKIEEQDICWFDTSCKPFSLYGLYKPYLRMPKEAAEKVSENVGILSRNTSGIRVRFSTDSEFIAIKCEYPFQCDFSHMPRTGTSGFDLYLDEEDGNVFYHCFVPPWNNAFSKNGYESIVHFKTKQKRYITINFPLYNDITSLKIGLHKESTLDEGRHYSNDKPIVFYGSSITHGGCASRPGLNYPAIISRALNADFINLGFSGNCLGEKEMAEYIGQLPMELLVIGYDYNAKTEMYLRDTHLSFYKTIRENNPDVKILLVSHPTFSKKNLKEERHRIIYQTYQYARLKGDKKVWYLSGGELFDSDLSDSYTVDGTHPNDIGMAQIAKAMIPVLKEMLSQFPF